MLPQAAVYKLSGDAVTLPLTALEGGDCLMLRDYAVQDQLLRNVLQSMCCR